MPARSDNGLITVEGASVETLVVRCEARYVAPEVLFDFWTVPVLLQQWWPVQAEVDGHEGGGYHLSWPAMNWHLRGVFTVFNRGRQLQFTWRWDHDPAGLPATLVTICLVPFEKCGTQMTLTHGPYADTVQEQEVRSGHLEGWQHFLPRLLAQRGDALENAQSSSSTVASVP